MKNIIHRTVFHDSLIPSIGVVSNSDLSCQFGQIDQLVSHSLLSGILIYYNKL